VSKKISYRCDLCRDDLTPENLDGLKWQGDIKRWSLCAASEVDFPHVCHRCEDALFVAVSNRPHEIQTSSPLSAA
jgi:hypothetical protein